jgi:leader peptidase (prepilin peptidase)/N-methyltransferase
MPILAAALLGAIFGSFIATLVIRWPKGQSVARGRSACDGCGAPVPAVRLIPVLSFLLQRGRAACCGATIDRLHPLAEILAAVIGAASVAIAPDLPKAAAGAIFGWLLLALALLDARDGWLPDRLTLPLAIAAVVAGLAGIPPELIDRLIGGAVGYLAFAGVRHGYRLLRGREGMGGGDVKLFGAIGLWLGWQMLPVVLFGAALAGILWSLTALVRGQRVTAATSVRFGTFLALAAWLGWAATAMGGAEILFPAL